MVLGHMITLCFSYSMHNHDIDTNFHYSWNFSKCNKMTITTLYLLYLLFFNYFFMPQHHISWSTTTIKPLYITYKRILFPPSYHKKNHTNNWMNQVTSTSAVHRPGLLLKLTVYTNIVKSYSQ